MKESNFTSKYLQKCRENVIVVKHELLDADSDHSADYGPHTKRGNENSGRNFDSKGENGDDQFED
jgi:hypothetical protein